MKPKKKAVPLKEFTLPRNYITIITLSSIKHKPENEATKCICIDIISAGKGIWSFTFR